MKVVDAIARVLKTEGAEFLGAYPTTPVIEAAAKADIRPVLCRQERVGVGIACSARRAPTHPPPSPSRPSLWALRSPTSCAGPSA